MRFLTGKRGLTIVEYILGGALALAVVGASVYGIITATRDQGTATEASVDAMPAQPNWP